MIERLERIRKRMHAVGSAPPESVGGYRALFEVVYAELDSIINDMGGCLAKLHGGACCGHPGQCGDEGYEQPDLDRILGAAARALERVQVADDRTGAADEAEAILSQVVTLSGDYVPATPVASTFTITVGAGKSDPIPYDCTGEQAQAAFEQAAQRNLPDVDLDFPDSVKQRVRRSLEIFTTPQEDEAWDELQQARFTEPNQ